MRPQLKPKTNAFRYSLAQIEIGLNAVEPTFYRQEVPEVDLQLAARSFAAMPGCTVIERFDLPEVSSGGILLAHTEDVEDRMGPDVGVVLSCDPETASPGDVVLFLHTHGKWIEDFECHGYVTDRQIVVMGRATVTTGEVVEVEPRFSILAKIDMDAISPNHIQPMFDWVLIERDELTQSVGGIELPLSEQFGRSTGVIVATGPEATDVQIGDRVMYQSSATCRLKQFGFDAGDRHAMFRQAAIVLVLRDDETKEAS